MVGFRRGERPARVATARGVSGTIAGRNEDREKCATGDTADDRKRMSESQLSVWIDFENDGRECDRMASRKTRQDR